jgi:hypothetical protein
VGDPALQATLADLVARCLLRLLFLTRHRNIILREVPARQGLDLTDQRGLAVLAPVPRAPAPLRPLNTVRAGPVVVERNDLGIRHR